MVRPVSQFCCGCSLTTGVLFIVTLHLLQNLFYLATIFCNVVLQIPTFNPDGLSLPAQTFNAAFCLVGLPFLASAFWGLLYRQESHIRLYLFYLYLTFFVDMCYLFISDVLQDSCHGIPLLLKVSGPAFACGIMRTWVLVFSLLVITVEAYFLFIVWSFAEDLKFGGSGVGLPELRYPVKHLPAGPERHLSDLEASWRDMPLGVSYGAFGGESLNPHRSSRILGGSFHEMEFPAPPRFQPPPTRSQRSV